MRVPGLTQTITVRSVLSVSTAGDPTFGPKRTMAARVQQGRDRTATTIEHTHVVYTEGEVKADDRVWFPGDALTDDTVARRPASVSAMRDLGGVVIGWKALF